MISGFDSQKPEESDSGILLKAQGIEIVQENIERISPWRFKEAISPDMASDNEKKPIDFFDLLEFCKKDIPSVNYTLIEGIGGIMTPLTHNKTVFNWIAELGYDTILVTGSYLGTLSHTLTAYEALAARQIKTHSVIISESEQSPVPLERMLLTLRNFLPNTLSIHCVTRSNYQEDLKSVAL